MSQGEGTRNLSTSSQYKTFIRQRDELLEKILKHTHLKITDEMNRAFTAMFSMIKAKYQDISKLILPIHYQVKIFEKDIDRIFDLMALNIMPIIIDMRKKSIFLAHAGEVEALRRTFGKAKSNMNDSIANNQAMGMFSQENTLYKKVNLYLSKLKRAVYNEIETGLTMNDPVDKVIGAIFLKLPKKKQSPAKKYLKTIKTREANPKMTFGMFDKSVWGSVLEDYEKEYVPEHRSPETVFDIKNPWNDEPIREKIPSDEAFYGWEVERDITHDFVKQVREGQIDAAKLNGVKDFVWIAVLDDKTCENCCEWRDGLTSAQIEEKLSKSKELSEHCDAIVPPAHFNCRCTIAPVTEDLGAYDISDTQKDFESWLYPNK